jgi:hypothetical protein
MTRINVSVLLPEHYIKFNLCLVFASGIDPKTLCPFCDQKLPDEPSSELQRLLKLAYSKSQPDRRSTNPIGRKTEVAYRAPACHRHSLESTQLPLAQSRGWPTSIDWDALPDRVKAMKAQLKEILEDPADCVPFATEGEDEMGRPVPERIRGARMSCVFWTRMLADRKKGKKFERGPKISNFDKVQPG